MNITRNKSRGVLVPTVKKTKVFLVTFSPIFWKTFFGLAPSDNTQSKYITGGSAVAPSASATDRLPFCRSDHVGRLRSSDWSGCRLPAVYGADTYRWLPTSRADGSTGQHHQLDNVGAQLRVSAAAHSQGQTRHRRRSAASYAVKGIM